ncbi:hypothetical protein AKJ62_02490 [candidate division MSBL1 archaeon SCGC-AAA259D14]|uniref:Uncharacterized protein n=2 Tax=candidate division MSBL1 TaxID=215777 RepID=A0A133U6D9_9EURY|nr:hypothetical protein AKJ62_02490 [candidate division MSBL1 archaeon SCGC-AAA259D14]KXA93804.1 hypothetical protein AKJ66_00835 [candidate division MSBL1 archaeon SCGC-AAA259E22]
MEMFEGKKGHRIYKNKEDADFLASLAQERGVEVEILRVEVEEGKLAKKAGFTVHHDISIAASPPSTGDQGWIIRKGSEYIRESLGRAVKIIEK